MTTFKARIGQWELPHVHGWKERGVDLMTEAVPLIGPDTTIATIGSCFASELAKAMTRLKLQGQMHPGGLFYTPRSIHQEFKRIFRDKGEQDVQNAEPFWQVKGGITHPFKDYGRAFETEAECRSWSAALDAQADALFAQPDVIVITLGLIEAWVHADRDVCYRQIPHPDVFDTLGARFHRLTVGEMVAALTDIRRMIKAHTDAALIVTVSPVPLHATFTALDVRVANTESKTRIRAAVSEVVETFDDVHYFPSYEIITTAERMSDFMHEDGRHVQRRAVDYILMHFMRKFAKDGMAIPEVDTSWITPPLKTAATPKRSLAQRLKHARDALLT